MCQPLDDSSCAPLPTGGYECDFVDCPPDSLQCPVCLLPFRDPHLLSCCGHKACEYCIGRIRAAGHPCPICQQAFTTLLDKQLNRKVLDLRVYCSKKDNGCDWVGELRDLQTHLQKVCSYVEVECQYKCGGRFQRCLLRKHEMEKCPQRPMDVKMDSMMRMMEAKMSLMARKEEELFGKLREHDHIQSNFESKIHALMVRLETSHEQHVQSLKVFQDKTESKLASLEVRVALVERSKTSLSTMKKDLDKQNQMIRELHEKNAALHDQNTKFISMLDSLKSQLFEKSCKSYGEEDQTKKDETYELMCLDGEHNWIETDCMICRFCGYCTGYGPACCNEGNPGRDPGKHCGCGSGDSGCSKCGACKVCAGERDYWQEGFRQPVMDDELFKEIQKIRSRYFNRKKEKGGKK